MKTFFFFWRALVLVSLVLGLEHSCPWPRKCLSSERLSLALASDFFCFLGLEPCVLDSTSGDYFVIVDYFFKYPEVVPLSVKTAQSVVVQCKNVFARRGIPMKIISDNMPFRSNEFANFLNTWGIKSTTSSTEYGQSNV